MNAVQAPSFSAGAASFQPAWQKKHGIPVKTCIKCGNVWKFTHYCPAEGVTCRKCYRTGHLTQYCFTYKNKNKKKNSGVQMQSGVDIGAGVNNNIGAQQQENVPPNPGNQPTTSQIAASSTSSDSLPSKKGGSVSVDSKKTTNRSGEAKKPGNKNDSQKPKHQSRSRKKNRTTPKALSESELKDLQQSASLTYQQKKYEKASIYYSRLIERFPNDAEYYQNRAICFMMLEQFENALADASRAIELKPTLVDSYSTLISSAMKLGCTMEAECHLKKLSELDPKNKIIFSEQTKLIQLQRYLEREQIALKNENYQEALENVNKCLLASPRDLRLKIRRAEYLAMLKRYDETQKVVGEILEKDPNNSEVKYILGIRIYDLNFDEALRYFNEVLRVDPDNLKIVNFKKKAEDFIQKKSKGNEAFVAGDYETAHEDYSSALKIDPKHTLMKIQLYFNMAQASWNLRNYQRAIEEYTKVISIHSIHLHALKQRGKCFLEIGEFEKAIADFTRVKNLNPNDPDCLSLMSEAETKLSESKDGSFEFLEKSGVEE